MPIYIDIPREYEPLLQEIADEEMRDYHQQAVWLLIRAIEREVKVRQRTRQCERQPQEAPHAPTS